MTMEAAPPRPPPDENPTWILAVAFAALVIALGTAMRVPSGPTKIITKRINVAKGRDATQSSLFQNAVSYSPSRAVDGNTSGSASAISSTEKNANAWWLVDLGDTYSIAEIKIWNREDCCQDRLKNFYVF